MGFIPANSFLLSLKQLYIGQPYVPRNIYVPVDFEDREALEDLLSEQVADEGARPARVHILVPQRGDKRALLDLAGNNAKQSYDQRFRVMKPNTKAIQEALQDALGLPELPQRIECFDISHIQGAETVASMVVWEDGQMKKSDYRKFIIRDVVGVDDFASMREVVTRRYKRLQEEKKKNAQPGADRRRARPVARRCRGARSPRNHQPAAGGNRQARRNYLRLRSGERTGGAGSSFAGVAPGATDPRRGAPLRRDFPSQAAPDARPLHRTAGDSRRGREHDPAPAAAFRQRAGSQAGGFGGAFLSGDAHPGGGDSGSLPETGCSGAIDACQTGSQIRSKPG